MRQIINGKVYDTDKLELIYLQKVKHEFASSELFSFYNIDNYIIREKFSKRHKSLELINKDNNSITDLFNWLCQYDNKVTVEELEQIFDYRINLKEDNPIASK